MRISLNPFKDLGTSHYLPTSAHRAPRSQYTNLGTHWNHIQDISKGKPQGTYRGLICPCCFQCLTWLCQWSHLFYSALPCYILLLGKYEKTLSPGAVMSWQQSRQAAARIFHLCSGTLSHQGRADNNESKTNQ